MVWKFWSGKIKCPITDDDREWLEGCLLWYEQELGRDFILHRRTFTRTTGFS
ncbi:hypothetical protein C900_01518 [Fulvivirga imtechensis AK7]|uniref:Uncharacterized protein n=1 Tax=Fulvivirga imtechensis AK7 TaxID=1237149 RepID=L8JUH8_9BACT|nr:hypothetical protein C900_01518 [Fulvivirga imtechensis AK7]